MNKLEIDVDYMNKYTKEELIEALSPVSSIISKCEKSQLKFEECILTTTALRN